LTPGAEHLLGDLSEYYRARNGGGGTDCGGAVNFEDTRYEIISKLQLTPGLQTTWFSDKSSENIKLLKIALLNFERFYFAILRTSKFEF